MTSHPAAPLVVPIGHCAGAYYDVAGPAQAWEHTFQVRVGPDIVALTDQQFAVWGLAHGTPDRPADLAWDRTALLAAAERGGLPDAAAVLDFLLADHLVAEVAPGTEAAVDFARRYRLVPLLLGLGNTADEPGLYSVGLIGQPLVSMSSTAYDLYQWAHLDPDLWVACEGAAATAVRVGIDEPTATDPHRLLDALLVSLHTLLGPNAVYLDTRRAS